MDELFEAALDKILLNANGDMRRAMRALLIENVRLQAALNQLGQSVQDENPTDGKKRVLH
jgi:hypothetical protein